MDENVVTITGKNRELLFDGFQTLLQLLPPTIYSPSKVKEETQWIAQCVIVHDKPRFQWRGLMIDPCRHFFGVDVVKTIIEGMSHYKLNVLHFHMTEDQAWRLDLAKYPNLIKYGSIRDASPKHWDGWTLDGIPYGPYYYTEADIKEIIKYANERSIQVVPEIEMPGHALALLSGYPQYSCNGGPFKPRCYWGVEPDIICAGNDEAIKFLEDLIDEVIKIFNTETNTNIFLHCGGDECPRVRWETCPKCQKRMKEEGLQNTDQLQCWFTQHFARYLESKGKRLIGWDDILYGGLPFPESSIIMSWRGVQGAQTAVKTGHDVIMTPNSNAYLDYAQHAAPEPYEYIGAWITARDIYLYDPCEGIDDEYKNHIIGFQGNLWSEYIWNITDIQWKAFPRALAIAENAWCTDAHKNWPRFVNSYAKADHERLKAMGLNEAGLQFGTQGVWKKGDFEADKWLSVEFPLDDAINKKGKFEIAFAYKAGRNKLKIRNVKLMYDGAVVGEDAHEGVVWDEPQNNLYALHPNVIPTGKVSLAAEVMCEGGSECEGHLYLYPTYAEHGNEKPKFNRHNRIN